MWGHNQLLARILDNQGIILDALRHIQKEQIIQSVQLTRQEKSMSDLQTKIDNETAQLIANNTTLTNTTQTLATNNQTLMAEIATLKAAAPGADTSKLDAAMAENTSLVNALINAVEGVAPGSTTTTTPPPTGGQ